MRLGRNLALAIAGSILAALALFAAPAAKEFTSAQKRWWAFQPVVSTAVPAVKNRAWVANDIDAFILAKLEDKGLAPNPKADKLTLIRRASLDLIGLPPTPEQIQAFLADNSPKAFEKVIDGLLASDHYGERWARHWLDLARYADSEGFKSDETRPNVWRYRDYVIQSLNRDKPYDRFVQEQIAGDELFPGNPDALVATGFNRHFPDESNARNLMQRRQEFLNDITDTVGSTFMAMTVGCAKCHDHKFDPILQKDYYRLQAFFANTRIADEMLLVPPAIKSDFDTKKAIWDEKTKAIRDEMSKLVEPKMKLLAKDNFDKFPPEIQDSITTTPEQRTPIQWHMYYKARPYMEFPIESAAAKLRGEDAKRYGELKKELATFDAIKPPQVPIGQGMIDHEKDAPKTYTLRVGVYDAYDEEVRPGFFTILNAADAKIEKPAGTASSGRRAALARWLTEPANPLTPRVMVNRLWHYHFGRGIVSTPSDFGAMGERPSHKELLDYLASTFVSDGWSLKKMHKRMLLSSAWQQSSSHNAKAAALDPDNKLVWRFNRQRLEGEIIRDSMLSVSGLLNAKMGGPGLFPPLPPGVVTRGGWKTNQEVAETRRRSVYTFVRRNTRYPMFEAFDMPDTHESCSRRSVTITSTQALELLNNELVMDWSRSLAKRIDGDVERAYRIVYARAPSAEEISSARTFLDRQTKLLSSRDKALTDFCHMLLNSNEFVYVN